MLFLNLSRSQVLEVWCHIDPGQPSELLASEAVCWRDVLETEKQKPEVQCVVLPRPC